MLSLGEPVTIDGQSVVILADEIAASEPREVASFLDQCPDGVHSLWLNEDLIESARANYPDYPIFGFWQLIFHNRLADFDIAEQVFPLSDHAGFFLAIENGAISDHGQYRGQEVMDLGKAVAGLPSVAIDIDMLTVPFRAARLSFDLRQEAHVQHSRQRRRWLVYAIAIAGLFVAYNWWLSTADFDKADTLRSLNSRQQQLASSLTTLRAVKVTPGAVPAHQGRTLRRFLDIALRAQYMTIEKTSFDTKRWAIEVDSELRVPGWVTTVMPKPTDTKIIRWRPQS